MRDIDCYGLVRACVGARDELVQQECAAEVIPVPVPRHPGSNEEGEGLLAALVARNYGSTHVVGPLTAFEGLPVVVDLPAVAHYVPPTNPISASDARELQSAASAGSRRGLTVLFTGLSGAGKSTVAKACHGALLDRTWRTVSLLDGDVVRRTLSAELTFSRPHRVLNIRRIGFVASQIAHHGGIALCALIAPYAAARAEFRNMVQEQGDFLLVHVSTPLTTCEARDRKGLYAKARRGEIPEFTGISDPYEEPSDADVSIDTFKVPLEDAVEQVLGALSERGWISLV